MYLECLAIVMFRSLAVMFIREMFPMHCLYNVLVNNSHIINEQVVHRYRHKYTVSVVLLG